MGNGISQNTTNQAVDLAYQAWRFEDEDGICPYKPGTTLRREFELALQDFRSRYGDPTAHIIRT